MAGINFARFFRELFRTNTPQPGPPPVPLKRVVAATVTADAEGTLATDSGHTYRETATHTGRLVFMIEGSDTGGATLILRLPGHLNWVGRVVLNAELSDPIVMTPVDQDFDPSDIPLREIARIRGAMWTVPGPWPMGPRPGQPNNVTSLGNLAAYPPDIQQQMIDHYKGFGYTHCVFGPPGGPGAGYGGWWPQTVDFTGPVGFELFLDYLQKFWNNGLTPVVFLHFDNENFQQTRDRWDPLIRNNPRAQRLIRAIVPAGWEPAEYQWTNATWIQYMKWARDVLPNALVLVHTTSDIHAPIGGPDEFGDDNGTDPALAWVKIAPYLHGWLFQSRTWERAEGTGGDNRFPSRTNYENWVALFDPNDEKSLTHRFRTGYAGWPRGSAWGPDKPVLVYAAEYCSMWITRDINGGANKYWEGVKWGDAAMKAGADGYLDSGSVDVPIPQSLR